VPAQQYQPWGTVWEVFSEEAGAQFPVFGKNNVIASPLTLGQSIVGTRAFTAYPPSGLKRNKDYYVWIATASWDGSKRLRVTPYYAWATFRTW